MHGLELFNVETVGDDAVWLALEQMLRFVRVMCDTVVKTSAQCAALRSMQYRW